MVDNRISNPNMHYKQGAGITVLTPPDELYKVRANDLAPKQKYKDVLGDRVELMNNPKAKKKRQFPLILKIIGGVIASVIAYKSRHQIVASGKKIFNRQPKTP